MSICNEIKISNTSNTYHIIECKSENSSNFDSVWRISSLAAELSRAEEESQEESRPWLGQKSEQCIYLPVLSTVSVQPAQQQTTKSSEQHFVSSSKVGVDCVGVIQLFPPRFLTRRRRSIATRLLKLLTVL